MKKINRIKLVLDALMLIALVLMYNKNVLGLSFHEIGGLAVCGLFIIHILLNGKWVLVITGKLFSPKIAWRNKLNWLIDFLLLLSFIYILVSGISISKVLFDGQRGASVMKTGHYAVSALALVLIGIHVGLHYTSILKRTPAQKLPRTLRRITAVAMSVIILGFGVYEMTATSFLHWMGNLGTVIGTTAADAPEDGAAQQGDEAVAAVAESTEPENAGQTDTAPPLAADGAEPQRGNGNGRGNGGEGQGNGNGNIAQADPSLLGSVLLGFLSITLSFAAVTAWIDGALLARRRNQKLKCSVPV
ncbi:MAG TPA: DUF4405 domain-containing protein [Candidatus Limiplasma sp.]|nr:DUF4405 domain-containing protein [Candidatus Limiplasma sp.]